MELFITCQKSLEQILENELHSLRFNTTKLGYAGVYVQIQNFSDIYKINYSSRIASRVLLPLKKFKVHDAKDLYDNVKSIDWLPYFKELERSKFETMAVDANVDHKNIRNSHFASQVVKDAICDQLIEKINVRPTVQTESPDIQLNLFIWGGEATLSFDTSGDPLHKRGYRDEGGEAPLRENLAAALLSLANYKKEDIFIDPCAGSCTFLIEALLIASNTPPGFLRKKWGFQKCPEYNEAEWLEVKQAIDKEKVTIEKNRFFGSELNKNLHRISIATLKRLGFASYVELFQGPFQSYEPKFKPTLMLTNPPYGVRLETEADLIPLYRDLGHFIKRKMAHPARAYVFTGSVPLSKEVGLAPSRKIPLINGGIEAKLLEFLVFEKETPTPIL